MLHPIRILAALAMVSTVDAALPSLADTLASYNQDFNTLPTNGSADFSVLPGGWHVVETGTNANTSLTADSGSLNSGNTYSYGAFGSGERALGLLASGSVVGRIEFRILNLTGKSVDSVRVRFSAEQWRFGSGTTDSMPASVQTNSATAKAVPALTVRVDQGNANAANPAANAMAQTIEATIPVALPANDTLVLTWTDINAAGSDDGWAIDDFQLRFAHYGDGAAPPPPPPSPTLSIHQIQGAGPVSPYRDSTVTFEGIVTADFQAASKLKGFYVQNPDQRMDGDAQTSEGILVYVNTTPVAVAVGDSVRVTGKVAEYFGLTEIVTPVVTVLASGRPLPSVTDIVLPLDSLNAAERWEGMRVRLPQELVVTGNYTLGRYGEFLVSPRRIMSATQVAAPGLAAQAALRADSLNRLVVNDASGLQNPLAVPYPTGNLSASNSLRGGDRVSGLVGVLDYSFNLWTLQPTQSPTFVASNARTANPPARTGKIRLASFNVLNYFTTLGTAVACGPSRNLECRGATDSVEFRRQKAKIVSAIHRLDADIVALMEIENHPTDSALLDLVKALDDSSAPGTWSRVAKAPLGSDAIKVALIHRSARAPLTDSVATLDRSFDPGFVDTLNRIPLAATFRDPASGKSFTVVVNHLKSKGSACAGDPDVGDGQGNCNQVRTRAARALAKWTRTRPTGTSSDHVVLLGDLNAYAKEDPLAALRDSGFVDLVVRDGGDSTYSYQFGSAFGTLDHALASRSLAPYAKARTWAINADEPVVLGYNREYKSAGQIDSFYAPDPYSSSDHDPVLVDLDFGTPVGVDRAPGSATLARIAAGRIDLDATPLFAGGSYRFLTPSGRILAEGSLDAQGRTSLRSDLRGTAIVLVSAAGRAPRSEFLVLP